MYEDPPEPTEEEMEEYEQEQAAKRAPTVRIEGVTAEAVQFIIRDAIERMGLEERVEAILTEKIEEAISESLTARIDSMADELLRPLIAQTIENGWPITNNYGERTGTKKFPDMLRERLFVKGPYDRNNAVEEIFRNELEKALKGEFGTELEKAKKLVRQMLDDEVTGRFRKAMRDGLGLKD